MMGSVKGIIVTRLPEMLILALMAILLWSNLALLLEVDVWRNDSMYYVSFYDDKLTDEGRWINFLLFRFLQLVPASLAILISYFCVFFFSLSVAQRVTGNIFFSCAFGLLCVLIPVFPVQLEWPVTLLFGFIFLAFSPRLQTLLPDHYFFLLTAILFMGTFSAFYFLMPLLFLKDLTFSRFWRLLVKWILAFVFAYLATNLLIFLMTGSAIKIAGWRNPNYVHSIDDLIQNLTHVYRALSTHLGKVESFLKLGFLIALLLLSFAVSIKKRQYWLPLLAIISGLGIYASIIPVGIYVQDRTTLSAFIALFAALFIAPYVSRKATLAVMVLMFLVAIRMAMVGNEGINWYKTQVDVLTQQFEAAMDYPPEEVRKVFVAAEMQESAKMFTMIEKNLGRKNIYSEGFSHPQYWVPVLKSMGYKHFRVCADLTGWDCEQIKTFYQERSNHQQEAGLFISRRLPGGDVLLMINAQAVHE